MGVRVRDPWDTESVEYVDEGDRTRHGVFFNREHKWTKVRGPAHTGSFKTAESIADLVEVWRCEVCGARIETIPDYEGK